MNGKNYPKLPILLFLNIALLLQSPALFAGPPWDTDDPEPVGIRGWELYLSSHSSKSSSWIEGTLPHFEVNYGVMKNMQLHLLIPLAFHCLNDGKDNYGIGDIEFGIKYRFISETRYRPQIGIFPICVIPTGNSSRDLGGGKVQILLPIWIQKSLSEKWQTYGGYGYWINPGVGHKNWSFLGWQVQYQLMEKMCLGIEVYYTTPDTQEGTGDMKFNIGSIIDLNDQNHILLSAGRSFNNSTLFQCYVGYLFTLSGKDADTRHQHMKQACYYASGHNKFR